MFGYLRQKVLITIEENGETTEQLWSRVSCMKFALFLLKTALFAHEYIDQQIWDIWNDPIE